MRHPISGTLFTKHTLRRAITITHINVFAFVKLENRFHVFPFVMNEKTQEGEWRMGGGEGSAFVFGL